MVHASARRTIEISSALVTLAWAGVVLFGAALPGGGDPISAALFLGIGALVPLAVSLLPPAPGAEPALVRVLPLVLVPTAVLGATSLVLGVGPAGGIAACFWVTGALVLALLGVGRIARALRTSEGRAVELGVGAGLVSLPVGAVWLVMSRLGVDPLRVSSLIVLCTAVHFHFTSFGAVTLMVLALRRAPGARARGVLTLALGATVVAIPLVAAGWAGVPVVMHVGVWMLAAAVLLYAAVTLFLVVPTLGSRPAKLALALSCLAPVASMPLAVLYVQEGVDLDLMVHVHGVLNAYGLVGLGLVAHALERRSAPAA